MPPLPLANRVGSLAEAEDPYGFYEQVGAETREQILRLLPAGYELGGRRLLDFGCGAGRTLRHFLDEADSAEIWGCDIDHESIDWLQCNLCPPLHALRNEAAPGLPFKDGHFDVVWALSVFTHLVDTWAAWLVELRRVLADDGVLIATTIGPDHSELIAKEGWEEDRIGMNALRHWASWEAGGPMVLHSTWWLRAHWGRAFEILEIDESPVGVAPTDAACTWSGFTNHRWLAMRKRDVTLSVVDLEHPEPGEPREFTAVHHNVRQLRGELDRELTAARHNVLQSRPELDQVKAANRHCNATIGALEREIAVYRDSASWRVTAPGRWLGRWLRRLLRRGSSVRSDDPVSARRSLGSPRPSLDGHPADAAGAMGATPRPEQDLDDVQLAVTLLGAFAELHPKAFFIEIGANDGEQLDPLAPLVRTLPWSGILVEPVPYVFERLRRNHAENERIALERAAIAESDGWQPFYCLAEVDDPARQGLPEWYDAIGSFDRTTIVRHGNVIPDIESRLVRIDVPCMTFESLCRKHDVTKLDLLLIDAEGYDWNIIRSIDLSIRHPRLLIFEHEHLPEGDRARCEAMLREAGYELAALGPLDTWCLDTSINDPLSSLWREKVRAEPG
jgi:FkbM family methyltransferase